MRTNLLQGRQATIVLRGMKNRTCTVSVRRTRGMDFMPKLLSTPIKLVKITSFFRVGKIQG